MFNWFKPYTPEQKKQRLAEAAADIKLDSDLFSEFVQSLNGHAWQRQRLSDTLDYIAKKGVILTSKQVAVVKAEIEKDKYIELTQLNCSIEDWIQSLQNEVPQAQT